MKRSVVLVCVGLALIVSCKKEANPVPQNSITSTTAPPGALTPAGQGAYGNSYSYAFSNHPITVLSNGDMIISGLHYDGSNDKVQVTRTNASGTVLWNTIIDKGLKYKAGSSFVASTGEVISIATSAALFSWTDTKVLISKLNAATGDTLWTRTYGTGYIDLGIIGHEDASGNYEILDFSGQGYKASMMKVAPNGDSLSAVVTGVGPANIYSAALVSSDNALILTGVSGITISYKKPVYICKYSNGIKTFENNIVLDTMDQLSVANICEASDGGFVICGQCYNSSNSTLRYGFLMKIDATGHKVWEAVLPTTSGIRVTSCVERNAGYLELGIYNNTSTSLYLYIVSNNTLVNSNFTEAGTDAQLLLSNGKLYRGIIGYDASNYQIAKIRSYIAP